MRVRIIVAGKPALAYAKAGVNEYLKRLSRFGTHELVTVKAGGRDEVSARLLERSQDCFRIALDERGESLGTRGFDYLVYALGGSTPENFLRTIGIEFNGDAPRLLEAYETTVPGLFLVGDLSAGPKGGSIIWAFNSANTAMRRNCRQYLNCSPRGND
jgi:thioredoxin reductase